MAEECSMCGAPFGSAAELVSHQKRDHYGATAPATSGPPLPVEEIAPDSPPGAIRCGFCGRSFSTGEELVEHNRTTHLKSGIPA